MPNRFLQVDDLITIDGFTYPLSEFLIDQPSYVPLQAPYVRRIYIPSKEIHRLHTDDTQSAAPEGMNYPGGDQAIQNKQAYKQAYLAREEARRPVEPEPTQNEILRDMFDDEGAGKAIYRCLRRLTNDVRIMQGKQPLSQPQFRNYIKGLMR